MQSIVTEAVRRSLKFTASVPHQNNILSQRALPAPRDPTISPPFIPAPGRKQYSVPAPVSADAFGTTPRPRLPRLRCAESVTSGGRVLNPVGEPLFSTTLPARLWTPPRPHTSLTLPQSLPHPVRLYLTSSIPSLARDNPTSGITFAPARSSSNRPDTSIAESPTLRDAALW